MGTTVFAVIQPLQVPGPVLNASLMFLCLLLRGQSRRWVLSSPPLYSRKTPRLEPHGSN